MYRGQNGPVSEKNNPLTEKRPATLKTHDYGRKWSLEETAFNDHIKNTYFKTSNRLMIINEMINEEYGPL